MCLQLACQDNLIQIYSKGTSHSWLYGSVQKPCYTSFSAVGHSYMTQTIKRLTSKFELLFYKETQTSISTLSFNKTACSSICVQQGQGSPTPMPTEAFSLPVSFFHFSHQLICGELPSHHHDQVLDDIFRTIYIKKPSNHCWYTAWIHLE